MLSIGLAAALALFDVSAAIQPASGQVTLAGRDAKCISDHLPQYLEYSKPIIVYYEGDCPQLPDRVAQRPSGATDLSGVNIKRSAVSVYIFTKPDLLCLAKQYKLAATRLDSAAPFTFSPDQCAKR